MSDDENGEEQHLANQIGQSNFANKLLDVDSFLKGKIEDAEIDPFDQIEKLEQE